MNQPPPNAPIQFSIKSLMALTACVAVLFGAYRLLLPLWPHGWPQWTLAFFLAWTAASVGQLVFAIWAFVRLDQPGPGRYDPTLNSRFHNAFSWGIVPVLYWVTFVIILAVVSPPSYEWMLFFGITSLHLAPAAPITGVKLYRGLRDRENFPLLMMRVSTFAGYALPPVPFGLVFLAEILVW